mmetsp:Transcript_13465/g.23896  ORF Transcript_13465/g.23896 Transcript_13465/m.23896 type:complete len:558 (+) Transcript_13465:22-1695(+)
MAEQNLSSLSVNQLRQRLQRAGVDYSGCIEKADLVSLLQETEEKATAASALSLIEARQFKEGLPVLENEHGICRLTQRINTSTDYSGFNEMWVGARASGVAKVVCGPDAGLYNATIHAEDPEGDPFFALAIFVGCFPTRDLASSSITQFGHLLIAAATEPAAGNLLFTPSHQEILREEYQRTNEQLRLGLDPCANGGCSKLYCSQRCSGCGEARYCSRDCQKSHWPTHKGKCKEIRNQRQTQKKAQKSLKREVSERIKEVLTVDRELTSGATNEQLKQEAMEKIKVISSYNCSTPSDGQAIAGGWQFAISDDAVQWFNPDEHWDAGVAAGLLPALRGMLEKESRPNGDDMQEWSFSPTNSVNQILLGLIPGSKTSKYCNAYRCQQFYVETEGAWDAFIAACEATILRSVHRKVPKSIQPQLIEHVLQLMRFITQLLPHPAVGANLVRRHAAAAAPPLARLLRTTAGWGAREQAADPDSKIEATVNSLAALFEVWCIKLGICPDFKARLGLGGRRSRGNMMYEVLAKTNAEISIEKGRPVQSHESDAAVAAKMQLWGM